MRDGVIHLRRAGAGDSLVEQFRAIVESERFGGVPVAKRLSLILTGGSTGAGGGNRDTPVYELCHLAAFAAALSYSDAGGRFEFFLGLKRATTPGVRRLIEEKAALHNWPTDEYSLTERGIKGTYNDETFEIWFDRIPVLMAFFEFICGIEDATFFGEFNDLLEEAASRPVTIRKIKNASNKIASKLRLWRRANIAWAEHEERFDRIAPYLSRKSQTGYWTINDEVLFEFWVSHSNLENKPIREYATVFDSFVTLMQIMRTGNAAEAASGAARLGTDFDAGEVEVDNDLPTFSGDWASPLTAFDQPGLKDFRFFKDESERAPMEKLMEYGPDALRLARAFLRLESFSPVQSTISNAIRFKRDKDSLKTAISGTKATTYTAFNDTLTGILEHVERLQLAVIYILQPSMDDTAYEAIELRAKKAFEGIRRKGFNQTDLNEDQREAFLEAADVLPGIGSQLQNFLGKMKEQDLPAIFKTDVARFSKQFSEIYGDRA